MILVLQRVSQIQDEISPQAKTTEDKGFTDTLNSVGGKGWQAPVSKKDEQHGPVVAPIGAQGLGIGWQIPNSALPEQQWSSEWV